MEETFLTEVKRQARQAAEELLAQARLSEGDTLVVGCSSSEVTGQRIGTSSSLETAEAVFEGIYEVTSAKGLYLAAQCCEHLNRAVIIEKSLPEGIGFPLSMWCPSPKREALSGPQHTKDLPGPWQWST